MSHTTDPGDTSPEGATDSSRDSLPSTAADAESIAAEPASSGTTSESASDDDDAGPPLPTSFDAFDLPQTLRDAIAEIGWSKPTPVQAATWAPITAGHDVLVQSQTGTGKTGAFCVPWLAQRFESGDAATTGVQLICLTPTRELAKQVCDELTRLARHGELVPLPIYGGTAMQPQLAALRTGVHAVVGTPGRVLDHIRRRSLDLSRVRMVVLDEADEMLSMGFLEDIHAILEACPRERQTTLFSATVPTEIERIARRYMRTPVSLRLSGDDVAAAAIAHAYYSVSSSVKTRDLLDVIAVEEPATALVFCNTREEVNLVASVLQREGFAAEPLSSDLTQAARERVLGWMREGRLRFLVATDVASRGIDISHISHVINYSFPENAESYVHRTGRTGRAGRAGQAISLIAASELGNFYYLKLQYPTITFSEKHLPLGDALQLQRSELKLDHVSRLFPELVSPEWTLLARNLMKDPRGERVIAFLLEQAMAQRTRRPSLLAGSGEEVGAVTEQEPGQGRWERNDRGRGGGAGGGGRDRDRGRGRDDRQAGRGDRSEGRGRSRDDRPQGDRPRGDGPPRDEVAPTDQASPAVADGERAQPAFGEQRNRRDRSGRRDRERVDAERPPQGDAAPAVFTRADEPVIEADDVADRDDDAAEESGALPIAGDEAAVGPDGQRRRRRRRRGRRDREQTGDPAAQTSAGGDAPALEAAGDDAIGDDASADEGDELAVATPDAAMGDDANPGAQPQGEGEQGRRRRRRRRRGRGAGEGPRPAEATEQRAAAPTDGAATEGDDEGDDAGDDAEGDVAADGSDPNQRGRRRRRRRGRRRGAGGTPEPAVAQQQVVVPQRPAGQDEILVDIDESELQLVRDQFGEIDELDDFTLKARRRGVLDTLAEEVELEDLTARDRVEPTTPTSSTEAGASADAEDDGNDDGGDEPDGDSEETPGTAADDEQRGKRRRRRRKKKKVEAEPPQPALMVPPHKDFWEVWATHFNYRDFEDPASAEPEPEPEPAPTRSHDFGGDVSSNGDDDWVNVRLSVGRSHAKKAADIRDLLADRTGLTGKAVRNLTVGDRDTEFQIGRRSWPRLARAFSTGVVIDGITAEVTLLTVDAPDEASSDGAAPDRSDTSEPVTDAPVQSSAELPSDGVPEAELPAATSVEGAGPASAP